MLRGWRRLHTQAVHGWIGIEGSHHRRSRWHGLHVLRELWCSEDERTEDDTIHATLCPGIQNALVIVHHALSRITSIHSFTIPMPPKNVSG